MRVVFYSNLVRRNILIAIAETNGETTIHDEFLDSNNNPTDGSSGKLTFDIVTPTPMTPEFIRTKQLTVKIKAETATPTEIREYLKLTI